MSVNNLTSQLPTHIEPFKWAEQGFKWSGEVPLSRFARIAPEVCEPIDQHKVHVDLRLYMDEYQRIAWLDASLAVIVPLTCQRCLEPVDTPLTTQVHMALLKYEKQAERLDDEADFIVLGVERVEHGGAPEAPVIDLAELLEDELLLTMPLSPRHESCENEHHDIVEIEDEPEPEKRDNPFEVLANLKGKLDS